MLSHKDSLRLFQEKLNEHFRWQVFVIDSTNINFKKYSKYIVTDSIDFKSCFNGRDAVATINNLKAFIVDESLVISGNTKFWICSGFPQKYNINDTLIITGLALSIDGAESVTGIPFAMSGYYK